MHYLKELSLFTCLKKLDLSYNRLTSVPSSIGSLSCLTHLNVKRNKIRDFFTNSGSLKNLTSLALLKLSHNSIKQLSEDFSCLCGLKQLFASHNELYQLPASFSSLGSLLFLDLGFNKFRSMPSAYLPSLHTFIISNNIIDKTPFHVDLYSNLVHLDLSHNQILSIPFTINQLTNLTYLDLSSNKLSALPASIERCRKLCTLLVLENDYLLFLPREIVNITSLSRLAIANLDCTVQDGIYTAQRVDMTKSKLQQLVSLRRSTSHPILSFALCYYATHENEVSDLVEYGGIDELVNMSSLGPEDPFSDHALLALSRLCLDKDHAVSLYHHPLLLSLLFNRVKSGYRHAIEALCNLCLEDSVRQGMLSNPNSLKFFEDVSKLIPTADKTLFNSIRRLFGSIGYISKYHPSYERGLRILSLDGGGTRSLTSVLILKKIEEMTGEWDPQRK
eukprot:TRINITY_DN1450_c0_g1_i19.p1 TRINITY_DN1450_c0_g1~~TRINITY_DN1450_c0_g1_i19.p1  ORF type:complete len:447 (+),score=72.41 TRINITY_DN1450_c0_g1_i19:1007-2347(+)